MRLRLGADSNLRDRSPTRSANMKNEEHEMKMPSAGPAGERGGSCRRTEGPVTLGSKHDHAVSEGPTLTGVPETALPAV